MLKAVSEPMRTRERRTVKVRVAIIAFVGMLVFGETYAMAWSVSLPDFQGFEYIPSTASFQTVIRRPSQTNKVDAKMS